VQGEHPHDADSLVLWTGVVVPPFPQARSVDEFRQLSRSDRRILAGAESLCRHLGLGPAKLFETGSLPVFAVGDAHVLKLYPPCFADECDNERSVLEKVHGALPIATPMIVASGEIDGWCYLIMDRVRGRPLDGIWDTLSSSERIHLAEQVGWFLKALHTMDVREMSSSHVEWPRFVRDQAENCLDVQRRRGLESRWLEQIPPFLRQADLSSDTRPVLLHTEIMRSHLFAERNVSAWSLSGAIDFEPAMMGAAEYEFASVGVFLTRGNGPALRALLLAYGYRESDLGLPLQRRFLTYTLLHRYSNLRWYLELLPPPETVSSLDDLAARWWAVGDEPEITATRAA
jgi:hygromycin-B 7''-O-kinase